MASPDICGMDVPTLYLADPANKQEPLGYVLCSEMGKTCKKNGCGCRRVTRGTLNGSTTYLGVCVVLESNASCVTSGDDYVTCAVGTPSKRPKTFSATQRPNVPSMIKTNSTSQATKTIVESNKKSASSTRSPSASGSGSVSTDAVPSPHLSSSSMNSTVLMVIIIIVIIFVALMSWIVRSYCLRRSKAKKKLLSRRNRSIHTTTFQVTSPSNLTGRSSGTPSFPAFDRRTRAMQSPIAGERGRGNQDAQRGRNTPLGHEPNSVRSHEHNSVRGRETNSGRGRRNVDTDLTTNGVRPMTRELNSGRGERKPKMDGARREPGSGRGRIMPNIDAQFAPNGPRGFEEGGVQRGPDSRRGQRGNYGMYKAEPRARQVASPKPVKASTNNTKAAHGGTVYSGRNTYQRVAQFAQLAAFEAPPPPPPRPQRPISSVPVSDAIPKHVRAPTQNARPAPPAPSVPKRPGFYIDASPVAADYDILSPNTARSLAPSIASSATTVVAPGRNRPRPLQQGRRPQHLTPTPAYYQSNYSNDDSKSGDESRYDESKYDESGFGNKFKASHNYDDSFVSEDSSMAWSEASGLSDDSYYHAPPSNLAFIPVIEAPHDDDDAQSEDAYSDWGHSTQQSSDDFRSTAASFSGKDASFFSVQSDFADSNSVFKEREF